MTQVFSMKKKIIITLFGVFLGIGTLTLILFNTTSLQSKKATIEVDWRALGEMDYITGAIPDSLKQLDGKLIKVPGFMVPLEDNQKKVTQFLLVPTPQACIHVPPPPPNQMLLVDIKMGTEVFYGPIWVHGLFKIKTQRTMYGDVSYSFDGIYIENYQ